MDKNYSADANLNNLKAQVSENLGINLIPAKDKCITESVQNIYKGGAIGGNMTRNMIEMAEFQLIKKYKNT